MGPWDPSMHAWATVPLETAAPPDLGKEGASMDSPYLERTGAPPLLADAIRRAHAPGRGFYPSDPGDWVRVGDYVNPVPPSGEVK